MAKRLPYILTNLVILLLGVIGVQLDDALYEAIGTSLIATGASGLVVLWALHVNEYAAAIDAQQLQQLHDLGISSIYPRRLLTDEYDSQFLKTRHSYDMMGFALNTFLDDNIHTLDSWKNTLQVRILVIHPLSPNCRQRDVEENDPPGTVARDVEKITRAILDLGAPNFRLKWYMALPVTNILRMDKVMWVGPYFMHERSRNTYVLKLTGPGGLFDRYLKHFDDIWTNPQLSYKPTNKDLSDLSIYLQREYGAKT